MHRPRITSTINFLNKKLRYPKYKIVLMIPQCLQMSTRICLAPEYLKLTDNQKNEQVTVPVWLAGWHLPPAGQAQGRLVSLPDLLPNGLSHRQQHSWQHARLKAVTPTHPKPYTRTGSDIRELYLKGLKVTRHLLIIIFPSEFTVIIVQSLLLFFGGRKKKERKESGYLLCPIRSSWREALGECVEKKHVEVPR